MTNAESETTSYAYDLAGNLESVSDPLSRVMTFGYDSVNRRNSVTVPSGDAGSTVFDVAGQVTESTSAAGVTATYGYDARGLVASITDELGNSQASAYDAAGRLLTATDARGNDTTFGYDANGRLESETDPLGGSVTFGYDLAGQRISVTDPNNATRTFTFDDGGRMTAAVDAENRITSYSYDAVGRRTGMTDARGITATSTFDDAGQLTAQVAPGESRSFSYNDAGRRTGWTDSSGATTVSFDGVGRMTEIVTPAGTVTYGFNAAGEQVSMTQPEGTVTNSYDANGHMASVSDWRGDSFTMTNDADGRMLTTARSNGVDTGYSYDSAGRLTDIAHSNGATTLESFAYTLDPNGNRTAVTTTAGSESYTLDALNRITAVSYPGGLTEAFVYDAAGNRTSHTNTAGTTIGYTVDATGQLVSDTDGTTYTYDDAGNLTGTSTGDSFVYDDYSRMTSATANGVTETYVYDAAGVRVSVDGQGQLWDRNGLPTLISTSTGDNYVHTAGVSRDGDDWLLSDAVGSVRATVDNAGAAIGTQGFTVYGEQLTGTGSFGFAGEQADPTGLIHLRARQYNPTAGRFTSVDPVQPGAPATTGWNLYTYAGNNPTTWGDPSGRAAGIEYAKLARRGALLGASFGAVSSYWTCDQSGNQWWKPSTDVDPNCQLAEIGLGAVFGALGAPGAGRAAAGAGTATGIGRLGIAARVAGVGCLWGAVEGGTGAALHAEVQGQEQSRTSNALSAAFGCGTAGILSGASHLWTFRGPNVDTPPPGTQTTANPETPAPNGPRVVAQDGDVFEYGMTGRNGSELTVITNQAIDGNRLVLSDLHIDGPGSGSSSLRELREFARDLGRQHGVDVVVIRGGGVTMESGESFRVAGVLVFGPRCVLD